MSDLPPTSERLSNNLILLQGREFYTHVPPSGFPETTPCPKYSLGSRCQWIPNPSTDWGIVIGQVYAPDMHDRTSPSEWSWLYLLLLDADSPSRQWLIADWVIEDQLELFSPTASIEDSDSEVSS